MAYTDANYYANVYGGKNQITDFEQVSREIDSLTFNRIVARGFDNLTPFQQGIIQDVCCRLADYEHESDSVGGVIKSYSINGVSMNFGSEGVTIQNGVTLPAALYEELKQTGLCWRYV